MADTETTVDWSGVQDACEHLDNCGVIPLADAVRGLDNARAAMGREIERLTTRLNEIRAIAEYWRQAGAGPGMGEVFEQIIKLIDDGNMQKEG
jgi:hypothetical protein